MKYPHLDNLIHSIREIATPPIMERLDLMTHQSAKEDWALSTRLSILAGIMRDLDRYNEMNPK